MESTCILKLYFMAEGHVFVLILFYAFVLWCVLLFLYHRFESVSCILTCAVLLFMCPANVLFIFFSCLIWISMRRLFLNAVSCLFPIRQPNNIFLFVQACALFCSFVPRVSFSPYSVILCYFKPVVLLIVEYHVSFRVCSPYCRIPCVFTFLFSLQ